MGAGSGNTVSGRGIISAGHGGSPGPARGSGRCFPAPASQPAAAAARAPCQSPAARSHHPPQPRRLQVLCRQAGVAAAHQAGAARAYACCGCRPAGAAPAAALLARCRCACGAPLPDAHAHPSPHAHAPGFFRMTATVPSVMDSPIDGTATLMSASAAAELLMPRAISEPSRRPAAAQHAAAHCARPAAAGLAAPAGGGRAAAAAVGPRSAGMHPGQAASAATRTWSRQRLQCRAGAQRGSPLHGGQQS